MSDPTSTTAEADGTAPSPASAAQAELRGEIERSLKSVRSRHCGGRSSSFSTEIRGDVIECHITDGPTAEDAVDPIDAATATDTGTYKREAMIAIEKLTHRRVVSFIGKRDKKTDVATEKFILDRMKKNF